MSSESERNLSRTIMMGMVVGSMIGAGIFSLPVTFDNATEAGPTAGFRKRPRGVVTDRAEAGHH